METQNSVRRLRRSVKLAQHEMADILGTSQAAVSRIERGGDPPDGDCALSLSIVFGKPLNELFPARFEQVAEALIARAAELDQRWARKGTKTAKHKREWLRAIIRRIDVTPA